MQRKAKVSAALLLCVSALIVLIHVSPVYAIEAPTTCIANKREGNIVPVAAEGHRAEREGGYFYASIAEQFVIHEGFLYL